MSRRGLMEMGQKTSRAELLIRQRVEALGRALPGAQKGHVTDLHQARVATRRLREAIPIATAGPRARKLQRTVRRLTRALGPVRELDVALQTLEELEASGEAPRAALVRLRQTIRSERQRLRAEMRRRLGRIDVPKLQRRAGAAARACSRSKSSGRGARRHAAAEQRLARRAAAVRAAIENAAGIYLPDRLHDVRLAVKKLRYALELAQELSGSRATSRLRILRDAQNLLGRMNDLEVLIARIRGVQGSSSAPDLRLSADLDALVRRLETECRQIHGHYMASRRRLLAVCDDIAAAAALQGAAASAA